MFVTVLMYLMELLYLNIFVNCMNEKRRMNSSVNGSILE